MFEHVPRRTDLDQVNDIADTDGFLIIHSVICGNVPKDPIGFICAQQFMRRFIQTRAWRH